MIMTKKKILLQDEGCPTYEEALEIYIRKCTIKNISEKTIKTYRNGMKDFLKRCEQNIEYMDEITSYTVENYVLNHRNNPTCNDMTLNCYLRSIRVFLYWAMEEKYIPKPFTVQLLKTDTKIKATYTDAELRLLLKKPNIKEVTFSEYKTWVYSNYLLATGNRLSSALSVKIKNIDFENGNITIEKAKNRKQQIIPMSKTLEDILTEYLQYRKGEVEDYLFCNQYGGKADGKTTQDQLAKYNKSRGVEKTSSHLYRHTFAKHWILNGGDIFRLQKILGHSDLTVVKQYVNMFSDELAIDFDKFNPLDNLTMRNKGTIKMGGRR